MNDWEMLKGALFITASVLLIIYITISAITTVKKNKKEKHEEEPIKEEIIEEDTPVIDPQGYELIELMRETGAEQYMYCKDRKCNAEQCAVIRMIGEAHSMTPICGLAHTAFRFDRLDDIKDLVSSYRAHCSKYNGCRGCSTKKFRKTYGEKGEFLECYLIYSVLYLHNRLDLLGDDQNGWSIPDRINM